MFIHQYHRAIAVLPSLEAIGQAVDQLVLSGFPLAQIFLLGKDRPQFRLGKESTTIIIRELLHQATLETVIGSGTNLRRGMLVGNMAGGMTGLLLGLGLITVPGINVLGSAIACLLSVTGITSLVGGILGAIVGRGFTTRQVKDYTAQVFQDNYLLVISGSAAEIFQAEHILYVRGVQTQIWGGREDFSC